LRKVCALPHRSRCLDPVNTASSRTRQSQVLRGQELTSQDPPQYQPLPPSSPPIWFWWAMSSWRSGRMQRIHRQRSERKSRRRKPGSKGQVGRMNFGIRQEIAAKIAISSCINTSPQCVCENSSLDLGWGLLYYSTPWDNGRLRRRGRVREERRCTDNNPNYPADCRI
jgi:hypothetical protein